MPIIKSQDELKHLIHIYCSPAVEMTASLHVLANPAHHSACTAWTTRVMKSMSAKLKENLRYFAAKYNQWSFIMDLATENENINFSSVHDTLNSIEEMDDFAFSYIFLGATLIDKKKLEVWMKNPESLKQEEMGELDKYITVASVRHYLKNIASTRSLLMSTLRAYWNESFQQEWLLIYQHILDTVEEQWMVLQRSDPLDYLAGLHSDISIKSGHIILKKDTRFRVAINDIDEIMIFPSVFTAPHLMIDIVERRLTIYMNLNFHSATMRIELPEDVLSALKAIGDETRLKIIKLLCSGEKTNQELSEILNLTPGTISLHVKLLREAKMLQSKKIKKFVYYEIIRESLDDLCDELHAFLK